MIETYLIGSVIARDYCLVQIEEFVTRIVVKAEDAKNTSGCPKDHISYWKSEWELGEAFRFKTPSSILVVGPSGSGKTCFTESLLLDHLEKLFVNPPPTFHYCHGAWQDGFRDMKDAGVQFHETDHLKSWFPKGGLLVLDDLMT